MKKIWNGIMLVFLVTVIAVILLWAVGII